MLFLVKAKVREFGKLPLEKYFVVTADTPKNAIYKVRLELSKERFVEIYSVAIVKPIANTESPVFVAEIGGLPIGG